MRSTVDAAWFEPQLFDELVAALPARHGEADAHLVRRCADGDLDVHDLRAAARLCAALLLRRPAGRRRRPRPTHRPRPSRQPRPPERLRRHPRTPGPPDGRRPRLVRWTRDPGTKTIIDRGAHTYRPSERLKAFIAARDRTCGFPGCNTPAQACDCDHIATYRLGGRTITINLGPLCRQHHNAKTHGRWELGYDPEKNTKTWTSPLGKTYLKNATPLLL